jgi:hypothetical protein
MFLAQKNDEYRATLTGIHASSEQQLTISDANISRILSQQGPESKTAVNCDPTVITLRFRTRPSIREPDKCTLKIGMYKYNIKCP